MNKREAPIYKQVHTQRPSDQIVKEIWRLILSGELKPGDRLPPERELVQKFKVSIVTLREALRVLEGYGHIVKKRGSQGGSFVLDITPSRGVHLLAQVLGADGDALEHLIEARRLVEPIIASLVAERITAEQALRLEANLAQHEQDFRARGTTRCGWEFYLLLGEFCGNPILRAFEDILVNLLLSVEFSLSISDLRSTQDQLPYNKTSFDGQKRVARAIFAHDPQGAAAAMVRLRAVWEKEIRLLHRKTRRRPHAATHPSVTR